MILGNGHPFPAGAKVSVYPRSAFNGHLPDGEPNGEAAAIAEVDEVGGCEIEGLAPGEYVAVSGETPARVRFTT